MRNLITVLVVLVVTMLAAMPAEAQRRGRVVVAGPRGPSHRTVGHDNSFSYRAVYSPVVVVDHSFDYGYGYGYSNTSYYNRSGIDYRDERNGLSLSSGGLFETMIMGKKVDRALDIAEARAEADRRREDSYAKELEFQELNALARDIKARQEQKQLNAVDELAQENERLKQELELKQEGAKLKAENQKLKEELKKLETPPAPVQK